MAWAHWSWSWWTRAWSLGECVEGAVSQLACGCCPSTTALGGPRRHAPGGCPYLRSERLQRQARDAGVGVGHALHTEKQVVLQLLVFCRQLHRRRLRLLVISAAGGSAVPGRRRRLGHHALDRAWAGRGGRPSPVRALPAILPSRSRGRDRLTLDKLLIPEKSEDSFRRQSFTRQECCPRGGQRWQQRWESGRLRRSTATSQHGVARWWLL